MLFAAFVIVFLILWGLFAVALPPLWHGLLSLANRAASTSMRYGVVKRVVSSASPFRDYLPVVLVLAAGILLAVWSGDGFLDLAEQVHANSPALQKFDFRVHDWAVTQRYSGATLFFATMSVIGGPIGVAVIVIALLITLFVRRHMHRIVYVVITVGGGGLLDLELKRYFARARPAVAEMLRHAHGYSFPSGHAMGSTVLFGAVSYLAIRMLPTWRGRSAALAFALTMILSVALSRVYLGVHWISDVGAGIVCGLLWVTVTTVAYETFRRIHLIRQLRQSAEARAVSA